METFASYKNGSVVRGNKANWGTKENNKISCIPIQSYPQKISLQSQRKELSFQKEPKMLISSDWQSPNLNTYMSFPLGSRLHLIFADSEYILQGEKFYPPLQPPQDQLAHIIFRNNTATAQVGPACHITNPRSRETK